MISVSQSSASNSALHRKSRGFSLIEVMVGMVIGLLATIIIMQSYAGFEKQKRTTTTGSDAQENGLSALHAIETDARMAGFGLVAPSGLACTTMNYIYNDPAGSASGPLQRTIAPVIIVDGGTVGGVDGSDTITFTYSTAASGSNPSILAYNMTDSDANPSIDAINTVGFTIDRDLYLVSTPVASPGTGVNTPCSRKAYTSSTAAANTIFNPAVGNNIFPAGGYLANQSFMLNMGSFVQNRYAVTPNPGDPTTGDLTVTSITAPGQAALPLASNIVSVQAQYGIAATNPSPGISSPPVTCWTRATGTGCGASSNWVNPNAADIMRIKAIRIAIVARSSLQEQAASGVGAAATCNATTAAPVAWAGANPVDLTANPNWQCHRYRLYQTIIPLRNVIWANI